MANAQDSSTADLLSMKTAHSFSGSSNLNMSLSTNDIQTSMHAAPLDAADASEKVPMGRIRAKQVQPSDMNPGVFYAPNYLAWKKEDRQRIVMRWIPLLFKSGGSPFIVQRHIEGLSKAFGLNPLVTYLPARVLVSWLPSASPVGKTPDAQHRQLEEGTNVAASQENLLSKDPIRPFLASEPWMEAVGERSEESEVAVALQATGRFGLNMNLMQEMENTFMDLVEGTGKYLKASEVHARLDELGQMSSMYPLWLVVVSFGVLSGSMTPAFFDGSWMDGLLSFVLGCLAGLMVVAGDKWTRSFLFVHEAVSSFIGALLTVLSVIIFKEIRFWPVVLGVTIWILPGFSIVLGFMDIFLKHPLTGLMFVSCGVFVAAVMGLGFSFAVWFLRSAYADPVNDFPRLLLGGGHLVMPLWAKVMLSIAFALGCAVIYGSTPRQFPLPIISVVFIFLVTTHFPTTWNAEYVNGFGAFILGLFVRLACTLESIIRRNQVRSVLAEPTLYISMLLLVPGSRIVRSMFGLLQVVHLTSVDEHPPLSQSFFIATAVGFGLVCSQVLADRFLCPAIRRIALGRASRSEIA